MSPKINPDLEIQANLLKDAIKTKFKAQERLILSEDPKLVKNDIVEYDKKLKISALDKFNNPGYACGSSFYKSEGDKTAHKAVGAVALYFVEKEIGPFLKAFGYTDFNDEEPQQIAEKCLEFGNIILEAFQQELSQKGYVSLLIQEPVCYRNGLPKGLDFSFDQYEKYEIHFLISGEKRLVAELTMTQLPKK